MTVCTSPSRSSPTSAISYTILLPPFFLTKSKGRWLKVWEKNHLPELKLCMNTADGSQGPFRRGKPDCFEELLVHLRSFPNTSSLLTTLRSQVATSTSHLPVHKASSLPGSWSLATSLFLLGKQCVCMHAHTFAHVMCEQVLVEARRRRQMPGTVSQREMQARPDEGSKMADSMLDPAQEKRNACHVEKDQLESLLQTSGSSLNRKSKNSSKQPLIGNGLTWTPILF